MSRIRAETGFLARQSMIYAIGNVLQRITSLLLLPVYTHYLTTSDYGIKELLTITTDVVGVLIATAIAMALFRIYFQYDDEEIRRQVISSSYVTLAVFGALVVGVLLPFVGPLAKLILDDETLGSYMVLAFAALWFQTLTKISYDYLRAKQKAVQVVAFSLLRLILALSLNLWFIVGRGMGVDGVLWSSLITSMVIFVVLTIPQLVQVGVRFSWPVLREMLTFGFPLVWSQLAGIVVHLSDRFFIKAMISISDAGLYSLGYRLGTLSSMFVVEPFNQTWLPRRYEIHKQPDHARVFGRIFTYYVVGLLFFALAISVLAKDILRVMSDSAFWGAAAVVPIIALGNTIFALHYHLNFGLMIGKKSRIIAVVNLLNAGVVLGLNWLMIPRWGLFGAAWATLLAFVFKIAATWFYSRRYYRPVFEKGRLIHVVVTTAALYLASHVAIGFALWPSIAFNCGLIALFPLVLWVTRFFHDGERAKVRAVLERLGRRRAAA